MSPDFTGSDTDPYVGDMHFLNALQDAADAGVGPAARELRFLPFLEPFDFIDPEDNPHFDPSAVDWDTYVPPYWRNVNGGPIRVNKATPFHIFPRSHASFSYRRKRRPVSLLSEEAAAQGRAFLDVDAMLEDIGRTYHDQHIFDELQYGARLGCLHGRNIATTNENHASARRFIGPIRETLAADRIGFAARGDPRPFVRPAVPSRTAAIKESPLAVALKHWWSINKYRRIDDSTFGDDSLNNGIKQLFIVKLATVDDNRRLAVSMMFNKNGVQIFTLLSATYDLEKGYKVHGVYWDDCCLESFRVDGTTEMHTRLSFGNRPAVHIFSRNVTCPIVWALNLLARCDIGQSIAKFNAAMRRLATPGAISLSEPARWAASGYVDDFKLLAIVPNPPRRRTFFIDEAKFVTENLTKRWRAPLSEEKKKRTAAASDTKKWLGIMFFYGLNPRVYLDDERVARLNEYVRSHAALLRTRTSYDRMFGLLRHAAIVIAVMKLFLNSLRRDMKRARWAPHPPSAETLEDLDFAQHILRAENGIPMQAPMQLPIPPDQDFEFYVDASTSWGWGAWCKVGDTIYYCFGEWSPAEKLLEINPLEMGALYLAHKAFADIVHNRRLPIQFRHAQTCHAVSIRFRAKSDNTPTVSGTNTWQSNSAIIVRILKLLYVDMAISRSVIDASHVPGETNFGADRLSRGKEAEFLTFARNRASSVVSIASQTLASTRAQLSAALAS